MKRLLLIPLSFLAVGILLSIPDHLRDRSYFKACERMGDSVHAGLDLETDSLKNMSTSTSNVSTPELDQLRQLITATFDGNLISKSARDYLVKRGMVTQSQGYNVITAEGLTALVNIGFLRP